jgi:hypothetical protein
MRRSFAFVVALCLALSVAAPAAAVDTGSTVRINPFHMATASADAGDTVVLEVGWGACTKGLAQMFSRAAIVAWSIDGEPLATTPVWTKPEAEAPLPDGVTTSCVNGSRIGWRTYGRYPTTFEPGVYTVSVAMWTTHASPDGGDYDGDGRPDFTGPGGWYGEASMELTVNP